MYIIAFAELFVLVFLIIAIKKKLKVVVFSPVYALITFYIFIAIGGHCFFLLAETWHYRDTLFVSSDVEMLRYGTVAVLFLLLAFCSGTLFGAHLSIIVPKDCHIRLDPSLAKPIRNGSVQNMVAPSVRGDKRSTKIALFLMGWVPLVFLLVGVGIENLITRDVYLPENYKTAKIIGYALSPVSILINGYLSAQKERKVLRLLAILSFFIYELIYFSLATRRFAIAPILFSIGAMLGSPESRRPKLLLCASLLICPFIWQLPISLRSLPLQGVFPFMQALVNGETSSLDNLDVAISRFFYNILQTLPMTAHVMYSLPLDFEYFFISINPLPGFMAGWYDIVDEMSVTWFMPYNATGELLNYGFSIAGLYYFILGIFFYYIDRAIRLSISRDRLLIAVTLLGLSYLFIITSVQYNLRSATRMIYYALFVLVLQEAVTILKNMVRR